MNLQKKTQIKTKEKKRRNFNRKRKNDTKNIKKR